MIEYRQARGDEREAVVSFADMVFNGNGDPVKFETELEKGFAEGVDFGRFHKIAIDDEKGIRGLVSSYPVDFHVHGDTLKMMMIGTVSTHPDARGEGHMVKLMNMWIDEARETGADAMLLGGMRQRYEHFGFAQGGETYFFNISTGTVKYAMRDIDIDGVSFEEIKPNTAREREAEEMHARRGVRYDRSSAGFALTCRNFKSHAWAGVKDGRLIGWLVVGDDSDDINEAHAETVADVDRLIKAWMIARKREWLTVAVPAWEREKRLHLSAIAEEPHLDCSLAVRIVNYKHVLQTMLSLKTECQKLADGRLEVDIDGQRLTITVKDNSVTVADGADKPIKLDEIQACRLFMTTFDYEGRPDAPEGWFPLPFFAASPDSF